MIANTNLFGQKDSFTIFFDASLRERFESWNGMNARNYGDPNEVGNLNDNILFQRVIAGFNYTPIDKITISAHLQDSRAFGWSLRNAKYPDYSRLENLIQKHLITSETPMKSFLKFTICFSNTRGY